MPKGYIEIEGQIFNVDSLADDRSNFSRVAAELATALTLVLTGCEGSVSPVPTESVGPMVTPISRDVEPTPSSSPTIVPEVEATDRPTETTEPTVTPEATATLVPISPEYHLDGPEGFGGVDTNGEFLSEEQRVEANKQWGFYKPYIEKMIEVEQYSGFVGVDNPTGIVAAVRVLDDGRVVVYPKVVGGEKDGIIILPMGAYFDMEGIKVPEMPQDWDPSQVTELSKGNGERAYYDDKYLTVVRADGGGNVFEAWNHSEGRWEMVEKEWTGTMEFRLNDDMGLGLEVDESRFDDLQNTIIQAIAAGRIFDRGEYLKEMESAGYNTGWVPSQEFRNAIELEMKRVIDEMNNNNGLVKGVNVPKGRTGMTEKKDIDFSQGVILDVFKVTPENNDDFIGGTMAGEGLPRMGLMAIVDSENRLHLQVFYNKYYDPNNDYSMWQSTGAISYMIVTAADILCGVPMQLQQGRHIDTINAMLGVGQEPNDPNYGLADISIFIDTTRDWKGNFIKPLN